MAKYKGTQKVRLLLIGFGNVGRSVIDVIRTNAERYKRNHGVDFQVTGVFDNLFGSTYDRYGLDLINLGERLLPGEIDVLKCAETAVYDVLVEVSYTDLQTAEPATSYVRAALERGKHVVTTNKGPATLHFSELSKLAEINGVVLGIEGTVMSGTPVLRMARKMLAGSFITKIEGILNGTTNYILTRMEAGVGYEEALVEAQMEGYAEADPFNDVEGFDAAAKVVILGNSLLEANLSFSDVAVEGITGLSKSDMVKARERGERYKLIGSVAYEGGKIRGRVRPLSLPLTHPLAGISGVTNALTITSELLGQTTIVGAGAGRTETAYALIQDLLGIYST